MPLSNTFFSKKQVAALYNLGKTRGIPVDSMRFSEFINYIYNYAYDIIEQSRYSSPSLVPSHISFYDEHATLLFDGETLYWQQGGNSTSWMAYSGQYITWRQKTIVLVHKNQ